MKVIRSLDGICEIFAQDKTINVYGAGTRLTLFFETLDTCQIKMKIDRILVSSKKGNPERIRNIPVIEFTKDLLTKNDIVMLTLSECYVVQLESVLEQSEAEIYQIDFDIIDAVPSDEIRACIAPFIRDFELCDMGWNKPDGNYPRCAWTMWWQGEKAAPDIVKACWNSQRKNLPEGVSLRILAEENFREYIDIPDYILDKYQSGLILPAHLSDIVRCCLLYKYGGVWLDSTILMCGPMPRECMDYSLYTRTTFGREFNAKAVWAIWFLCAHRGEKLFRFVMEAYFYYFKHYDRIKYYLTTDYLIGIACNLFPDICGRLNQIPYNNIKAMVLGRHLDEPYDEESYKEYTEDTFIQKLTWHGDGYREDSVYRYIIRTYGGDDK